MNITHTLLAAAVGGVLVGATGCGSEAKHANDPSAMPSMSPGGSTMAGAKHACKGQNACKGQGACKTDKNGCKGQNACKGQGGCKTA